MASLASAPSSQIIHNPADHENGTKSITLEKMVSGAEQAAPLPLPTGVAGGLSAGDEPVEITAVQKMVSAISGSLLTGLLVTPLDVVRVRLQSQTIAKPESSVKAYKLPLTSTSAFRPPANIGVTACCREVFFMNNNAQFCVVGGHTEPSSSRAAALECAVEQTQQRTYNSTIDGLRKIARNEGATALWRGLSPTLLMAVPGNIIYFTGYEWLRFNRESPIVKVVKEDYSPLVAGSVARILAAGAVSPIELFRTRLQASHGSSAAGHLADTFRGIREMVGLQGYRSLWRGLTLTLWRDVPFSGMYWWGYEFIRGNLTDARERGRGQTRDADESRGRARRRSQSRENHAETFVDSFVAGASSGAFASVATMPFDVGKTRTQVYQSNGGLSKSAKAIAPEERSMVQLLWHIFRTEGAAGLFKGWIPRTLKVAPACAIMISSYEVGKRSFRSMNERKLRQEMELKQS
ncbi:hypothetical protein MCOR27_003018 [Pyricularia oryzae]|uniref:Solute carrier family 25 member 40 n=4 Tax=Pyricularia oryzae TaxID=318829 RepID=G4N727_PYRO7|nr:solute carrier family 25 member 40 [Pyricularia oryzae 70-15]ELQ36579.1 solute carrier family 25 member 40 [Pyricularia oryzae Y34]KAH9431837.1 hypothetical protein MCOR02_009108 [Pyricularia oryzae]EHA49940.1 solute carrier family 25 member 40 [Pyricularia oryzae 70-15]KAI6261122.1 hypothetical protein MCOR19_002661 [Pyricularia oryzae]KAI6283941.1 hypothetical protein MCOR27_003018 [Pyricularia oryzae]